MKAWVLHNIGDIRYEDVPKAKPLEGEVLVKVEYAGVCSSDIPRIFKTGAYHYPLIPGHEFSGVVASGERTGQRVCVFPLIPCFKCEPCRRGEYETCNHYSYIGSRRNGAFAEYVSVPVWNLIELPDSISLESAALFEPAAVALHAVKRLNLQAVKSAAIIGKGTIGRLAAEWLRLYGVNEVEMIGRNDEEPIKTDACLEAAGTPDALARCINIVKPGGQIVLIGNPSEDYNISQAVYWQILRKQLTVTGSWNSSYPRDWTETLNSVSNNKLKLEGFVTHKYSLKDLSNALDMMRMKKEFTIKVLISGT